MLSWVVSLLRCISIHALREESDIFPMCLAIGASIFQSTLSVRRATCAAVATALSMLPFQSTLSVRRATELGRQRLALVVISIHALREESDPKAAAFVVVFSFQSTLSVRRATHSSRRVSSTQSFQSTLSVRRATSEHHALLVRPNISIHALREESDQHFSQHKAASLTFQSTLSVRRATTIFRRVPATGRDFNPRSP